jgi:RNA polymerase sigma-70 factor (ECF subfamily)
VDLPPDDRSTNDQAGASEALLRESALGDAIALEALVERHLPALRVYVRLRTGQFLRERESCSDVVQSVCRELLAGAGQFEYRGEGQFRNWLYAAALNKIRQHDRHFRAAKRDGAREEPLQHGDESLSLAYGSVFSPSQGAMANELRQTLEQAFDELPDPYQEVIVLSRVVGLSQAEMAEQLGKSVASVRNLLNRAMVRFAALADT